MIEYYKDSENNYYRLICRAKEGNPHGNEIAILQELKDDGNLFTVPATLSDDLNRIDNTEEIKVVLSNCPIDLNPKYRFPYIEYQKEKPKMRKPNDVFSKSVQSMVSLLSKDDSNEDLSYKYFEKDYLKNRYKNDDVLEDGIIEMIKNYKDSDNLEEIFHLIQIWGGSSGRGIYVFKNKSGEKYSWQVIEEPYKKLVEACRNTNSKDEKNIHNLVEAVTKANESISHLGVSFITKHVRFWLYKQLGEEALPIYDSIMAIEVMRKKEPYITDLEEYWNVMVAKADREKITLMSLERQIFLHAYESINIKQNRHNR